MIKSVELMTVSKEVAEALEKVKEDQKNNFARIVEYHVEESPEWSSELAPLNSLSLDSMIRALYIGYEVEKTPEEKIKELFDSYGPQLTGFRAGHHEPDDERVQMGIKLTLDKLGMKVEGINDDNN
jgi:hypothetical protein